jgi:N6-L-threonylcarbamoyladenine synthase
MLGRPEPHFSFSGLKTALRQEARRLEPLKDTDIRDLCASFQQAIAESVSDRIKTAMQIYKNMVPADKPLRLVAAGGVAANGRLRSVLKDLAATNGFSLHLPPLALCGDNAAMIAWAGAERLARGLEHERDFPARARWPLDENAAKAIGAGVKA